MNLNYLYRQLRKRCELKHYEIKPIGSAIRLRRKELKMTLEEGAEGICSISYLSKLENNQIDPNLDFVDQLVERFGLKEQITFDMERYDHDLRELTELMIHLDKPKRCFIDGYRDREDHQARVIHLIESAINQEFDLLFDHYKVVQQFIPHLKQSELTLVLLALAEGLIAKERYLDAYHVTCEIPMAHESFYDHYLLTLRMRLKLSFMLHQVSDISEFYHHYIDELSHQGYYQLVKEIKCSQLMYLAHYQLPLKIHELSSLIDRTNELDDLPYGISCFKHQLYDEVIDLARTKKSLYSWLSLYLISLEEVHAIDELKYVITNKIPDRLKPSEEVILNHMKAKYVHDQTYLLHYLRRDLLGNRIVLDNPLLMEYLMMDGCRLFAKSQFYKEATLAISQYHPHIKKLSLAYQRHIDEA